MLTLQAENYFLCNTIDGKYIQMDSNCRSLSWDDVTVLPTVPGTNVYIKCGQFHAYGKGFGNVGSLIISDTRSQQLKIQSSSAVETFNSRIKKKEISHYNGLLIHFQDFERFRKL